MLLIGNSATSKSAWVPTSDEAMPCEGPVGNDVDLESHTNLFESLDTTIVLDRSDTVDDRKQERKR